MNSRVVARGPDWIEQELFSYTVVQPDGDSWVCVVRTKRGLFVWRRRVAIECGMNNQCRKCQRVLPDDVFITRRGKYGRVCKQCKGRSITAHRRTPV